MRLSWDSGRAMVRDYVQRSHSMGTVSDDAIAFAKNLNWELG